MNAFGHKSAPHLIEWTGGRCVPWVPSPQLVYEHFHRYLWAASLVANRRVLDLASGEGFGAAILAQSANEVIGIDIDPRTIEHSKRNYDSATIDFRVGDGHDLSAFDDGSFGAVVAFEMIEHVADQARVLAEIARVLAPDGLLTSPRPIGTRTRTQTRRRTRSMCTSSPAMSSRRSFARASHTLRRGDSGR